MFGRVLFVPNLTGSTNAAGARYDQLLRSKIDLHDADSVKNSTILQLS